MGGADADLLEMLLERYEKLRRRRRVDEIAVDTLNAWYEEVLEKFGVLWEASRNNSGWNRYGHFHLGLLKATTGRSRVVNGNYKRDVLRLTRNITGTGVRTPSQLLSSAAATADASPPVRLSKKQRQLQRSRAAKSQRAHGHSSRSYGVNISSFEQFNYFFDCRTCACWELLNNTVSCLRFFL